jgi:hypothetical protein
MISRSFLLAIAPPLVRLRLATIRQIGMESWHLDNE